MTLDEVIERYVKARDLKAQLDAAHKEKVAKLVEAMGKMENYIAGVFSETGQESARTTAGTAYRQKRVSATVNDWQATLAEIIAAERWELLERRVSKVAVEEYIAEKGEAPPGVNINTQYVINVRAN